MHMLKVHSLSFSPYPPAIPKTEIWTTVPDRRHLPGLPVHPCYQVLLAADPVLRAPVLAGDPHTGDGGGRALAHGLPLGHQDQR